MGLAQHSLEIPVVKNTSALLAFAEGNETIEENPICIRCGKCSKGMSYAAYAELHIFVRVERRSSRMRET